MSKLKGPFEVTAYNHEVVDASGSVVADCDHYSHSDDGVTAAANAQMVAAALNAVYYMQLATGDVE